MNKKWTKLKLSKKYDRMRLPALNFAFELLYMQDLSVQNTRSLKRIVHCRIDKLLPLPLGEIHCRPTACKLFFCSPSVLQVLKNLVNRGFGHSQRLEGFDSGICAKRVNNQVEPSNDFIHGLQVDPLCGC